MQVANYPPTYSNLNLKRKRFIDENPLKKYRYIRLQKKKEWN